MRLFIASATALAMLLVASTAGAYEIRMSLKSGSKDPANINVGDSFVYEVFLDTTNTQATSRITLFSFSYTFDPTVVRYDQTNSYSEAYYPLYAPAAGKTQPATWLQPIPFNGDPNYGNAPRVWGGLPPAPGVAQLNVDFIEVNLGNTVAMDTNLLIAEVAFNAVGPGSFNPELSFKYGGNVFSVETIDISVRNPDYAGPETLTTSILSGATVNVPEPSLASLALCALGTVGLLAARRRRD